MKPFVAFISAIATSLLLTGCLGASSQLNNKKEEDSNPDTSYFTLNASISATALDENSSIMLDYEANVESAKCTLYSEAQTNRINDSIVITNSNLPPSGVIEIAGPPEQHTFVVSVNCTYKNATRTKTFSIFSILERKTSVDFRVTTTKTDTGLIRANATWNIEYLGNLLACEIDLFGFGDWETITPCFNRRTASATTDIEGIYAPRLRITLPNGQTRVFFAPSEYFETADRAHEASIPNRLTDEAVPISIRFPSAADVSDITVSSGSSNASFGAPVDSPFFGSLFFQTDLSYQGLSTGDVVTISYQSHGQKAVYARAISALPPPTLNYVGPEAYTINDGNISFTASCSMENDAPCAVRAVVSQSFTMTHTQQRDTVTITNSDFYRTVESGLLTIEVVACPVDPLNERVDCIPENVPRVYVPTLVFLSNTPQLIGRVPLDAFPPNTNRRMLQIYDDNYMFHVDSRTVLLSDLSQDPKPLHNISLRRDTFFQTHDQFSHPIAVQIGNEMVDLDTLFPNKEESLSHFSITNNHVLAAWHDFPYYSVNLLNIDNGVTTQFQTESTLDLWIPNHRSDRYFFYSTGRFHNPERNYFVSSASGERQLDTSSLSPSNERTIRFAELYENSAWYVISTGIGLPFELFHQNVDDEHSVPELVSVIEQMGDYVIHNPHTRESAFVGSRDSEIPIYFEDGTSISIHEMLSSQVAREIFHLEMLPPVNDTMIVKAYFISHDEEEEQSRRAAFVYRLGDDQLHTLFEGYIPSRKNPIVGEDGSIHMFFPSTGQVLKWDR